MGRGREGASLEVVVQGRALACSLVDCQVNSEVASCRGQDVDSKSSWNPGSCTS